VFPHWHVGKIHNLLFLYLFSLQTFSSPWCHFLWNKLLFWLLRASWLFFSLSRQCEWKRGSTSTYRVFQRIFAWRHMMIERRPCRYVLIGHAQTSRWPRTTFHSPGRGGQMRSFCSSDRKVILRTTCLRSREFGVTTWMKRKGCCVW
jgi:hypothetical protein